MRREDRRLCLAEVDTFFTNGSNTRVIEVGRTHEGISSVIASQWPDVRQLKSVAQFVEHAFKRQLLQELAAQLGFGIHTPRNEVEIADGPTTDLLTKPSQEG